MNKTDMMAVVGGGICVALLLGVLLFTSGNNAGATRSEGILAASSTRSEITTDEANTWAEARAADNVSSYRVYLAAYPDGAFADKAHESIGRVTATRSSSSAAPARSTRVAAQSGASSGPSRATIRSRCHAWVNAQLSPPSKTTRAATGAAAGCAVGALAGGNDGRNCAIGAVAGGATGYITAGSRERRREEMYQSCVARGGPG